MIDTANPDDIDALAGLLAQINALHAHHVPGRFHTNGTQAELAAFWRDAMAGGAMVLVERRANALHGYLSWKIEDRPATALEYAMRRARLDHIFVDPGHRRQGIAARLIGRFEAEAQAAGCHEWYTTVHAFNAPSRSLMRGAGASDSVLARSKRLDQPS